MKIAIGYPPFDDIKGTPLLSQNRQYQVFHIPTYIYPLIPAYAATMLAQASYQIVWLDGIAEKWSYKKWLEQVKKEKPDLILMETKTPVIKRHWEIINKVKCQMSNVKCILAGDHVTALPEESFKNSQVDYVLTGGDYDFLLLNLVNHLTKGEKLEPGIWYKKKSKVKSQKSKVLDSGKFKLNHDLDKLPFIDRELTKWQLYAYENGNYKRTPGTYIMAGRDCWWHRCSFCSWTTLYPQYRVRCPENVLDEIGQLIEKYKIKEIMDDSGTFPVDSWLKDFCQGMIDRGYNKKIYFDCNLRFGALSKKDYHLMAKAGFRMLLYGLESANQKTLNELNKGIKVNKIEEELKIAKQASRKVGGQLEPHLTCMVGYPWETGKETKKTIEFTRNLFQKGLINSLQATIVVPYPGTKLFYDCQKRGLLKTKDWNRYDMKESVIKNPLGNKKLLALTRNLYQSALTPKFILRKISEAHSWDDFRFLCRAGIKFLGHLLDFKELKGSDLASTQGRTLNRSSLLFSPRRCKYDKVKNYPLVSIIITTKNEEKNIGRCLMSIFNQNCPKAKIEVIVVDNYSQDKTVQIAKKFPVKLFQKGPERATQRNFGVTKSSGKYLMFIDADMALDKNLVKEAVEKSERQDFDALILPEKGVGKGFWAKCQALEKKCYLKDKLLETPNRFIKKEVYKKIGGYDRGLIAGEDFDLGDRIKKAKFKIGRTNGFIGHYEKTSLWQLWKKKFYYGKKMSKYFKKSGLTGIKRFNLFRPAYVRHWKLFIKDPLHGLGLAFLKTTQWLAGGFGFLIDSVK